MRFLFFAIALTVIMPSLRAQDGEPMEVDFGKLAEGELLLMPMGADSAADAYVLYDQERMAVDIGFSGKLQLEEARHRRVKLIRESSFDRADVEIRFRPKSQKVLNLDAAVHLPNGETIKLKNRDFIREELTDELSVMKWTFPSITPGAVIEYRYLLTNDYITVPPRYTFQESIPVRYTEYSSVIPGIFSYVNLGNGTNFNVRKSEVKNKAYGSSTYSVYYETYGFRDLPAYKRQPYVNNFEDYIPNVRYQLQSITYPDGRREKVFSDWHETAKEIDGWDNFGKAFSSRGMSNSVWKEAEMKIAGLETETEKAEALYNFVTTRVKWDGDYDWTSDRSPDKVFEAGTGNSGEINLMLLALLKNADIKAHPMLISLRGGGSPIQVYPIMSQFRHVMVVAELDGTEVIMDPNDRRRPMGLPRVVALNHTGMVMDPANPHWMDINVPPARQTVVAGLVIDETGKAEVDITSRMESYYAFNGREKIASMEKDDEFPLFEDIMSRHPEAAMLEKDIKEEERKSGQLDMTMKLNVQVGEVIDDYMYLQPILMQILETELADAEQRLYPVDFPYPMMERYISNITLPEGYVLDELPESLRVRSEDGSISCLFTASSNQTNQIGINLQVSIDRTVYQPDEYVILRQIFKKIIELQETTLVIKRAK